VVIVQYADGPHLAHTWLAPYRRPCEGDDQIVREPVASQESKHDRIAGEESSGSNRRSG